MAKIYRDTIGLKFLISTGDNLSDATDTTLIIKNSIGGTTTWDLEIEEPATKGIVSYVVKENDLDKCDKNNTAYVLLEVDSFKFQGIPFRFRVYETWE